MFRYLKNKLRIFIGLRNYIKRKTFPKFLYFLIKSNKPISNFYGLDRGKAIDRFYIESFLEKNKAYIKGDCLELLNNDYTIKYGGKNVLKSDILDINRSNKKANVIGDIRDLKKIIPDNSYDCIILTQVLQFIDEYNLALLECKRILRTGGSLLITVPSISRVDCVAGLEGDFWRFTEASLGFILRDKFKNLIISSYGNVKTGIGFWIGLSQEEFDKKSFEFNDSNFPILITAVVNKDL